MSTQMKATHTPGPWILHENLDGSFSVRPEKGGPAVCMQTSMMTRIGWDRVDNGRVREQRANARLIAAAPEMLEALENTTQTLRLMLAGLAATDYPSDARKEVREEINLAEAAIRKAKGEL